MLWKNLDGDGTIEARVFRAINLSHTASAKRGLNFVGAEFCTGSQWHARAPLYCIAEDGGVAEVISVAMPDPVHRPWAEWRVYNFAHSPMSAETGPTHFLVRNRR